MAGNGTQKKIHTCLRPDVNKYEVGQTWSCPLCGQAWIVRSVLGIKNWRQLR